MFGKIFSCVSFKTNRRACLSAAAMLLAVILAFQAAQTAYAISAWLDDFNRPDGPLGPNWTVKAGTFAIAGNAARGDASGIATYNGAFGNVVEGDVAVDGTANVQYAGFVLNYGAGVNNLFIKVQQNTGGAGFAYYGCYTGNNSNSWGAGGGFFSLSAPFNTAHMQVERVGTDVNIAFTNVNGGALSDQTYTCTNAPPPEGLGVGVVGYNNRATVDNFSAPGGYVASTWSDTAVHILDASMVNMFSFPAGATNPNDIATDGQTIWTGHFSSQEVVAHDFSGVELYRWSGDLEYLQGMTLVYSDLAIYRGEEPDSVIDFRDPVTGVLIRTIPGQDSIEGLAFDGRLLWQLNNSVIYGTDPLTGAVVRTIPNAAAGCGYGGTGIAAIGPGELTLACADGNWYVVSSVDGSVLSSGNNGLNMYGLAYTPRLNYPPMAQDDPGRLFVAPFSSTDDIVEIDPLTGAEIHRFSAPEAFGDGSDGLAFDGASLWFINGLGSDTLYQLDPATGAILFSQVITAGSGNYDGLAALNGLIYITDYGSFDIHVYDPATLTVIETLDINGLNPSVEPWGLAGIRQPDALIAINVTGDTIYLLDPQSGLLINSFATGLASFNAGVAVIGQHIYTGDYYNPQYTVFTRSGLNLRTVITPYRIAALGGDGANAHGVWTTLEDTALNVAAPGILENDFDPDGDALLVYLDESPLHGMFSLYGDGSFDYQPDPDYFGVDSFAYHLSDGIYTSTVAIAYIEVLPVQDTPVAVADPASGGPVLFVDDFESGYGNWAMNGLWNPEAESDPCGAIVVPFPSPSNSAYFGQDGICTYSTGTTVTGTLTLLTPINLPTEGMPRLTFWSYEDTENVSLENSVSEGGEAHSVNEESALPSWDRRYVEISTDDGASWILLGELESELHWYLVDFDLRPYAGQTVLIRFRFDSVDAITNNYFGWMVDNVQITNVAYLTLEDTALTVPAPGVLSNDFDVDGESITLSLDVPTLHGALTLNADGSFSYTPDTNYFGYDRFTYFVTDGISQSNVATAYLLVEPIPDAPAAVNDVYTTTEEIALVVPTAISDIPTMFASDNAYSGNMFDVTAINEIFITGFDVNISSGRPLEVVEVWYKSGTYVGSETTPADWVFLGSAIVTPQGYNNPTHVPIGGLAIPAGETYGLYIQLPDVSYGYMNYTDGENTYNNGDLELHLGVGNGPNWGDVFSPRTWNGVIYYRTGGVLANDSDADSGTVTAIWESGPAHGLLTLNADGSFVYSPGIDFFGVDTFTYRATDGGLTSNLATVTINVTNVNDPPDVNAGPDQTVDEGQVVHFTGVNNDPGRLVPAADTIHWDLGDGSILVGSLIPTHSYADEGVFTVTLTITDTGGLVDSDSLLVTVNNVAPALDPLPDQNVLPGEVVTVTAVFVDPGWLDSHTVTIEWAPGITESLDLAAGVYDFSFDHTFAAAGNYTVTVTITDLDGGIVSRTFVVHVYHKVYLPIVLR